MDSPVKSPKDILFVHPSASSPYETNPSYHDSRRDRTLTVSHPSTTSEDVSGAHLVLLVPEINKTGQNHRICRRLTCRRDKWTGRE